MISNRYHSCKLYIRLLFRYNQSLVEILLSRSLHQKENIAVEIAQIASLNRKSRDDNISRA